MMSMIIVGVSVRRKSANRHPPTISNNHIHKQTYQDIQRAQALCLACDFPLFPAFLRVLCVLCGEKCL